MSTDGFPRLVFLPGVRRTPGGRRLRRERPAAVHIPYSAPLTPDLVVTRSGTLLTTIKLGGYRFETASADDLQARLEIFNNLLMGRADSRFALWAHLVRRRERRRPDGSPPAGYAAELDRAWQGRFSDRPMFVNELYLTLLRQPGRGVAHGLLHALRRLWHRVDRDERRYYRLQAERLLDGYAGDLLATLADYNPRRLTTRERADGRTTSDVLGFLSYLINHEWQRVGRVPQNLAALLPQKRVSWNGGSGFLSSAGFARGHHLRAVSVKQYTNRSRPGAFDGLLTLPFEFVAAQSFTFIDPPRALAMLDLQRRRLEQEQQNTASVQDALDAMDDLRSGRMAMGHHHCSVIPYCDNAFDADEAALEIAAALREGDTIPVVEDLGAEAAYWAMLPGNHAYVARACPITSRNFACFAGMHNLPEGRADGNHWGPALTLIETTGGTPYFLNLHVGDRGAATITGVTGAGKTTLLNFLIAQSLKFGGRRILFDKDRGSEVFVRAVGGRYHALTPGEPSGLNPLRLPDTGANRQFLYQWFKVLFRQSGYTRFSPADERTIREAVDGSYTLPPTQRRLQTVAAFFGAKQASGGLRLALDKWLHGELLGWAFDGGVDDSLDLDAPLVGIEMGQVLDEPDVRTPLAMYLLYRVRQAMDGTRLGVFLEEGWRLLDDPVFVPVLKDFELTARKQNGLIVFAIQQPSLALTGEIGRLIFNQSATQIFFPDDQAQRHDYVDTLGLSERQYQLIRTTPKASHVFLLRHDRDAVLARLDLTELPDHVRVLSGRSETVRLLDRLRAEHGDDPAVWLPRFYREAPRHDG